MNITGIDAQISFVQTGVMRLRFEIGKPKGPRDRHLYELTFTTEQADNAMELAVRDRLDLVDWRGGSFEMDWRGIVAWTPGVRRQVKGAIRCTIMWTLEALRRVPPELGPSNRWLEVFSGTFAPRAEMMGKVMQ